MSYDTDKSFVYTLHGNKLRLYRFRRSSKRPIDTEGRVSGASGWNPIIYPDENITNGLRIEYTALTKPFVAEDPESTAESSLTEVSSPSESTHVNMNRLLSLAVVEYVKAMLAEKNGQIDAKEYFMKQFYNKLSDNSSNKNRVYIAGASSPYSL